MSHPEHITPITIELWHFQKNGYQHMILDGWHRINAAAILGINIMCGNFYGRKDVYNKIKVKKE